MTIQNIKNDIQELRGATVSIFGQSTTLSAEVEETTIDILEVLESLQQYEKTDLFILQFDEETEEHEEAEAESVQEFFDFKDELGDLKEITCNNSYNWLSPVSNDFDFTIYKDLSTGYYLVEFKVHRFGDVRGNYTDTALLEFTSEDEFYCVVSENNKYLQYKGYDVSIDIFSDTMEVFDIDGGYVTTITDLDELNKLEKAQ